MAACLDCRLRECHEAASLCLCCCHDIEYEAGFDDSTEEEAEP